MGSASGYVDGFIQNNEKKRIKGSGSDGGTLTSDEFAVCCFNAGLTSAEIDEWNIGTILDFIHSKNKSMMKSYDKEYHDDEERYNQLKAIEPLADEKFNRGEISKEKYDKFKRQLSEWK